MNMQNISVVMIIAAIIAITPAHAQDMCFDREFDEKTRYDVDVGWAKPNPLDPKPETVEATVDADKLLEALRGLEGSWRTPSGIWPTSAVQIEIYKRGLLRCQAIYTREEIYAMDKDAHGFRVRRLAVSEYFSLNEALNIPSYAGSIK